jgi:hypothetical protein
VVPVIDGGSNPSLQDIRESLSSQAEALAGFDSIVQGAKVLIRGPDGFTVELADVMPAPLTGAVMVRGVPAVQWATLITPSTTLAPNDNLHQGDVWYLDVPEIAGGKIYYTVGEADGSVASGLEAATDGALDATYTVTLGTVSASNDSVRVVRNDGMPVFAGNLKQIRALSEDGLQVWKDNGTVVVQPGFGDGTADVAQTQDAAGDWTDTRFFLNATYTLNRDGTNADFTSGWVSGETWVVT